MPLKAFRGGLELSFFSQREFEPLKGIAPSMHPPILARNILRLITMGWNKSWKQFITPITLYTLIVQRDPQFVKEVRLACQQGFEVVFEQLKGKKFSAEQSEQVQLYLSNCLCMLPFVDLNPYESFKIPQCIDGNWEFVEYQITPIELTETRGWRRHFAQENDRVFAYGLHAISHEKAESILLFSGTTYPTGQGFFTHIASDMNGLETVGKSLYESGRARLQAWASKQQNPIHVCGPSLGGALGLLFAMDKGHYVISRVDALGPPGQYELLFKSKYNFWDKLAKKPLVVIQIQGNDIVPSIGYWKEDWVILRVNAPKDKRGPNSFCDHLLNYAGFAETEFVPMTAKELNASQSTLYCLGASLARSAIYYYGLLPYTHTVRPILYKALGIIGLSSPSEMHTQKHPRNHSMDMYKNTVELRLTNRQIGSYYMMMRCMVKGKEFLPDHGKESHVREVSKKVLLEACLNKEKADERVSLKVSKAKAVHIKRALTFIDTISNKEHLKAVLEGCYVEYRRGKN